MTVLLIDLFYNITAAQYHDLSMYLHLIWIAAVILITYALFPTVCGWLSFQCFILKVSVFFSSGGVVLASRDGKIVFESTLDARLEVVFRKKLPEVPLAISFSHLPCDNKTFELSSCAVVFFFFRKKKLMSLQLCALFITGIVSFF